jgi:methyl-accepting chemotaxis protein
MVPVDKPTSRVTRKPLGNFVFEPKVQWPQIVRNGLMALFTSLGTGGGILWIYHKEFGDASIYIMDRNSVLFPLDHSGLLAVLTPAVAGPAVAGVLLGWLLTLGASRRIALPIYKVKQWAEKVSEGDLHARLGFRPGDGLESLAESCNSVVDTVRSGYADLEKMSLDEKIPEAVRIRLGEILSRYSL